MPCQPPRGFAGRHETEKNCKSNQFRGEEPQEAGSAQDKGFPPGAVAGAQQADAREGAWKKAAGAY